MHVSQSSFSQGSPGFKYHQEGRAHTSLFPLYLYFDPRATSDGKVRYRNQTETYQEPLLCPSAAGPVPAVFLFATPLPSIPPSPACVPSPIAHRTHGSTRLHTIHGGLPPQRGRRHRPQTRRSTRHESSDNWPNTSPGLSSTI